ncbi:MAG: 16S rRNA (guanine(966)-N(2))-methyltransferase RsmD [Acidobacteriota bacterium]
MRVIAGEFRRRLLKSIPGMATRPTPDRLRETMFNILQTRLEGVPFVDAYAGTGAVGIEAMSRGAKPVVFIERSKAAAQVIKDNLASLGALGRAKLIHGSVGTYLASQPAGIVFLDPPYTMPEEYETAFVRLSKNPPDLVVVQHATQHPLPDEYPGFRRVRGLKQGDNSLSFYERTVE